MGVVIDEVTGTVEQEPHKAADDGRGPAGPQEVSLEMIRRLLEQLEQREARLRAD